MRNGLSDCPGRAAPLASQLLPPVLPGVNEQPEMRFDGRRQRRQLSASWTGTADIAQGDLGPGALCLVGGRERAMQRAAPAPLRCRSEEWRAGRMLAPEVGADGGGSDTCLPADIYIQPSSKVIGYKAKGTPALLYNTCAHVRPGPAAVLAALVPVQVPAVAGRLSCAVRGAHGGFRRRETCAR